MRELHKSKTFVWGLFFLFCIIWCYMLGARTLVPTDEGRYAEMAREMVATGDWITLRLNGIKYFEKPPLQTWMNALTFEIFGLGEWQARLWTGLCGLLGVVLVAFTGRKVFSERVGFFAALVLGSSFLWAGLGHINTLDMGLAGMMTLSLCGLLLAQRSETTTLQQRNWMLVCWAGMALAVLSKGLIGLLLPGAVLILYTLFSRDWSIWKRLHLLKGLVLFFVITTPWFVLITLKNPEFPQFFFIHEQFQRFTSKIHHRYGPPYYFVPILLLGIIPWLGVLFQSLWNGAHERSASSGFQPKKLLLVWTLFIFVFFSISDSKLPSYILPIFPSLALLIACHLDNASNKAINASALLLLIPGAIGVALAWKIPALAKDAFSQPLMAAHVPWVFAASVIACIGAIAALLLSRRQKEWAIVALAASGFVGGQLLMYGHDPQGRYSAGVNLVPAIQAELTPETPLYVVGKYEQALPFYLRRTMIMVQHMDELEFGLTQEPQLWIPTLNAFAIKWTADHAAGKKDVAIIRPENYLELKERGLPMRVIAQDPRRVVVTNAMLKPGEKPDPSRTSDAEMSQNTSAPETARSALAPAAAPDASVNPSAAASAPKE
ncbi:glycosyltransferase family 39 protein [Glaciimonas immobilis]|uniref:4-amino-4-deoxy-L-arabinose transferase-like glycosyltransferase n=1 Tax=Glaciimonas immobilis TaxID=728004 RepID=A0A840RQY9_9BURK|nr:glycosyltransferase family 39 protein [Glaciimonas immobilis]KAF3999402.1 glycosyltransferase family 39 protein [Glaciimonas immobilis]MBB5198899.1 4-amino-4-deoxy-L-arabinose transferase-like glycosyltransferase [Glaciimonas immobilis]